MILRNVHDTNWKAKGEPERVFTVSPHADRAFSENVTGLMDSDIVEF